MANNILKKIIENKKLELEILKSARHLSSFKAKLNPSTRDFKQAISNKGLNLIAEIKKASPSAGMIAEFNLIEVAKLYNNYADAISVITDTKFFKASIDYLKQIDKITKIPLLRKDFIIDEYQIYESRYYGADAILLIASLLTKQKLNKFICIAKQFGMDCLVEVHTKQELDKVLKTSAEIIGINNRNLDTFEVDMNTTLNLLKYIPQNKLIVSESGFNVIDDLKKVKGRVNAVLIGTSIIISTNIEEKLKEFLGFRNVRNFPPVCNWWLKANLRS